MPGLSNDTDPFKIAEMMDNTPELEIDPHVLAERIVKQLVRKQQEEEKNKSSSSTIRANAFTEASMIVIEEYSKMISEVNNKNLKKYMKFF